MQGLKEQILVREFLDQEQNLKGLVEEQQMILELEI